MSGPLRTGALPDALEFNVLGSLEVVRGSEQIDLGPHRQRSLLAMLVVNANRVVSVDGIVDALWPEDGDGKQNAIWVYVSRLRAILEPDRSGRGQNSVLVTKEPGYVLAVDSDRVDALRFEEAVADARAVVETERDHKHHRPLYNREGHRVQRDAT